MVTFASSSRSTCSSFSSVGGSGSLSSFPDLGSLENVLFFDEATGGACSCFESSSFEFANVIVGFFRGGTWPLLAGLLSAISILEIFPSAVSKKMVGSPNDARDVYGSVGVRVFGSEDRLYTLAFFTIKC